MNEIYHRVCCPNCGSELSKSAPGSKAVVTCGKCKSRVFYAVNAGGPMVEVMQLRSHNKTEPRR